MSEKLKIDLKVKICFRLKNPDKSRDLISDDDRTNRSIRYNLFRFFCLCRFCRNSPELLRLLLLLQGLSSESFEEEVLQGIR